MLDYNNTPLPDCEGFTPFQLHKIVYYPFDEDSPIKINKLSKETLLNKCPIMKVITELLLLLKSDKIKLTQKGNLPPTIIKNIYAKRYLPDRWIDNGITKLRTETDWIAIHNTVIVLKMAGLIGKKYNYLFLTKKCESLLNNDDYPEIFYEFLKTFTSKFNWAYNDRYEDENLGRIGFLYSLDLLSKYGKEKKDIEYYTDLYFSTFPAFIEYNDDKRSILESVYRTRFIERFALWFGFAEEEISEGKTFFEREIKIKSTELLEQLLQV